MRKSKRGFTLLEIIVAVSILAILVSVGFPLIDRTTQRSKLKGASREVVARIHWARGLATTRTALPAGGGSGGGSGFGLPPTIVRASGITIVSNTQYAVFVDDDDYPGNEVTMQIVDLEIEYPGSGLRITAPNPGDTIRLRANASLLPGSPNEITLMDSAGLSQSVRVGGGGVPKLL